MADLATVLPGVAQYRVKTVVARADGSPITSGTVNYYLKALTGTNAGKWWDGSAWQATETANAMTHQADGNWSIQVAAGAWVDGDEYLEYVKESGDLHIPDGLHLFCRDAAEAGDAMDLVTDAVDSDALAATAASEIADAVLDEPLADHDTEDSVGNVLNDLTEESGDVYRFTSAALGQAPANTYNLTAYLLRLARNQVTTADTSWTWTRGDTQDWTITIIDANGDAVDLTGATIIFRVRKQGSTTVLHTWTLTIDNATGGVCHIERVAADWDDIPDEDHVTLEGELKVTYSDGSVEHVYDTIAISVRDSFA